ncbi:MAG: hypothetical protein B7X28_07560 [Halothiobacillus sp. 13-55-253]|nr:MAG: hypothetical protein B7X28_07560 [Halothiobacillus sp. 13-55-253]
MYETILTAADWQRWLEQIKNADKKTDKKMDWVAFDTETDSLDLFAGRIVGVSFSIEDNRAAYVPLAHNYPGAPAQLDRDTVLADLKPWLEDASRTRHSA